MNHKFLLGLDSGSYLDTSISVPRTSLLFETGPMGCRSGRFSSFFLWFHSINFLQISCRFPSISMNFRNKLIEKTLDRYGPYRSYWDEQEISPKTDNKDVNSHVHDKIRTHHCTDFGCICMSLPIFPCPRLASPFSESKRAQARWGSE